VIEGARALPGVSGAAYTSFLPMAMGGGIWPVTVAGRPEDEKLPASLRFVTADYFRVMGIPVVRGRGIADGDTFEREPWVAVVSESFAERHWPGEDAIGKTFFTAFAERRIVGVVRDVRVRGLERASEPQMYFSPAQAVDGGLVWYAPKDLVIRSSVAPATLLPSLRAIVAAADGEQPIADVRTLREVVEQQTAPRRVQLAVIGCFAALAFLLAGVGIYGLLSFGVTHRAQEIGVRMALGATPGGIVAMVLREGLVLTGIGALLGVALAAAAGRSLEALLAGVEPTDTVTFAGALLLAFAATLAGSLLPAWRASRVDPAGVMRAD
jgi:predicted permease